MLAAAGIVSLAGAGVAGTNIASAMTNKNSSDKESSLVEAIANKFNLNKTDVQKVFDEQRQARHDEMKQERLDKLKEALGDKKITQAQYDYIVAAWDEIDKLMTEAGDPRDMTDAQREAIKNKMDELRNWARDQKISKYVGGWGEGRGNHHGGHHNHHHGDSR